MKSETLAALTDQLEKIETELKQKESEVSELKAMQKALKKAIESIGG